MKELFESNLSENEKRAVLHHAAGATKILEYHPEPIDYIRTVLLQSHGNLEHGPRGESM